MGTVIASTLLLLSTSAACWSIDQTRLDMSLFTLQTMIRLFVESFDIGIEGKDYEVNFVVKSDVLCLALSAAQLVILSKAPKELQYWNIISPILQFMMSGTAKNETIIYWFIKAVPIVSFGVMIYSATILKYFECYIMVVMFFFLIYVPFDLIFDEQSTVYCIDAISVTIVMLCIGQISINYKRQYSEAFLSSL